MSVYINGMEMPKDCWHCPMINNFDAGGGAGGPERVGGLKGAKMKYEERKKIYRAAVDAWGVDAQQWIVVEELGELQTALSQMRRGRIGPEDVADEIADATIMLEQLQLMLGVEKRVEQGIDRKIERLRRRLESQR